MQFIGRGLFTNAGGPGGEAEENDGGDFMPKIPVNEKHRNQGIDESFCYCTLALAVNDALKDGFFAKVSSKDVQIFNKTSRRRIYISRQQRRISRFDEDSKIARTRPDHIILDIPAEFLRMDL